MAAELVGGALVGVAAQQCVEGILHAKYGTIQFRNILDRLEETINSLTPKLRQISESSDNAGLPEVDCGIKQLIVKLTETKEVVNKCSKIACWNCCKRYIYSKKLLKLDTCLRRIIEVDLQVEQSVMIHKVLDQMKELEEKLEQPHLGVTTGRARSNEFLCIVSGLLRIVHFGLQSLMNRIPNMISIYLRSFWERATICRGYRRLSPSFAHAPE